MRGAASPRLQARITGFLYLIVVLTSVFALIATSTLIVRDPATTAANIRESEGLFRLAFVANLVAAVAYTAVVALLCKLLEPVSKSLSLVAAFIGLAGCVSSATFMVNQLAALSLLGGAEAPAALTTEQAQALARQFLRSGGLGNSISLVFFGCYCLLLGGLVRGAAFLPRIMALPLMVAGAGWLTGNLTLFLAPDIGAPLSRYLLPLSGLGELIFTLWLLAFGVDTDKWRQQSGESLTTQPRSGV